MISSKEIASHHPSSIMAAPVEHTHHIKIRSTQMEMSSAGSANRDEDYDRKLKDAQEELDRIQLQREELERKKSELEELTARKILTGDFFVEVKDDLPTMYEDGIPKAEGETPTSG